ncbi:hypothetical protein ACFL3U_04165 [Pseudomonadota bacterium]
MRNFKKCIWLILALTLGACSSIKSTNTVGDYALKLNPDEWNGTWVIGKGTYQISVINPDFGVMISESIKDGKTEKHRMFVTQTGSDKYINLVNVGKNFSFAKFKKEKDSATVWMPSKEMFKKAITDHKIAGEVDKNGNILITASGEEFSEFLKTNPELMLFEYDSPSIFKRLVE